MIPGSANPLLLKSAAAAAGGYQIERSLRFNSSDSAFLSRTPAVAGNRRTWTWAGWVKRSNPASRMALIGTVSIGSQWLRVELGTDDKLVVVFDSNAGTVNSADTVALFRDPSAWLHAVVAFDTTQSNVADRCKLYVNGVQQTANNTLGAFAQNTDYPINAVGEHRIGSFADLYTSYYSNGYLADIHFIDGQALTPSSFTEVSATTGQLIPKAYTGTYTGNSFWLKFSDNSAATATTLGKDSFLLGNNWTPNNLSVTAGAGNDSLVDTPTSYGTDTGVGGEVRGNYATLNPIGTVKPATGVIPTLTNGNLDAAHSGGSWQYANSTIAVPAGSGKYYCEFYVSSSYAPDYIAIGVNPATASTFSATVHSSSQSGIFYSNNGEKWVTSSNSAYGSAYTTGDIIGVALNCDSGQVTFYKNNTSQGAISFNSNLTNGGTIYFTIDIHTSNLTANFGQRSWAYAAPSGFRPLVDTLLPAPVVAKPNTVFDVKLYDGNGSTQTISGLGFSPDLVWIKARSTSSYNHFLLDTIRGVNNELNSNTTDFEYTRPAPGSLTAFNSDGFNLNTAIGVNANSTTYVAWCWDAGSDLNPTTINANAYSAGVPSITSQVRANASAGFSIVTYTGNNTTSTVGHGLGVTPGLVIVKSRSASSLTGWMVKHSSLVSNYNLALNLPDAAWNPSTNGYIGNLTSSTTFELVNGSTNGNNANQSGVTYVAYCFAPVVGYSSFGSYTGNGSTDGPFVYTGFRPRWVMIKRSDSANVSYGWFILDTARNTYNVMNTWLAADSSAADGADVICDTLANGFKIRTTAGNINTNAGTFVYACFAESPLQYARAR